MTIIPELPRLLAGRTRLHSHNRKRELPRIGSRAGCGGVPRERHGWRGSIGFGHKPIPGSSTEEPVQAPE